MLRFPTRVRSRKLGAGDPLPPFIERTRIGRRVVCISRPNPEAYGHLALEIHQTFALARRERAAVLFVGDPAAACPALYDLRADGVTVVTGRVARSLTLAFAALVHRRRLRRRWASFRAALDGELKRRSADLPRPLWRELRRVRLRFRPTDPLRDVSYYRRRLFRDLSRVSLPPSLERRAREELRALGIDDEARLVCVHARESGFKRGRESEDKASPRFDAVRNASIADHGAAIDLLRAHGFTVVRIGDPSMRPFDRPDVIDLATSPARTPLLEVACMLRAEFLVCGESGPFAVSHLTDTPLLCVNGTDVISSYPIRSDGFLLMKTVVDRATGTALGMTDLVSDHYVQHLRDPALFSFVDNTPDEIRAALAEALRWLDGDRTETDRQRRYRELATAAAERHRALTAYARKWGTDGGFLGDGRVVDFRLGQCW